MKILNVALKDWKQILRDWKSALFLVVMPMLFTAFFGLVMGSALAPEPEGDPRLPVAVIDRDNGGSLSGEISNLLEASSSVQPVIYSGGEITSPGEWIREGTSAAVVVIPPAYSDLMLAGESPDLEVYLDPNSPAGQTAVTAIETAVNRLRGAVEVGKLSAAAYQAEKSIQDHFQSEQYQNEAIGRAVLEWKQPPLTVVRDRAVGDLDAGDSGQLDGFAQASSGMIVQFAIFGLITAAMILVLERNQKTLQRMLTTPIDRWEIIAGHMMAMFVVIFVQQAVLILFGQFVFGVDYLREPLAVLLLMTALALWAASLGLLISALARGEEQVITLSLIAMFLFASLGGAWFPLEVAGDTFSAIGHFLPTAWAMDGFQNLLVRGLGLSSVFLPVGILFLYAAGFFSIAVWRFRFE